MSIKYIFFRDTFVKYSLIKWGKEKGNETYTLFSSNANSIVSHLEDNSTWKIDCFNEAIITLNYIEMVAYQNNVPIFIVESPYDIFPKTPISYESFLEEKFSFYKGFGEKRINKTLVRLYFCSSILDSLIIYDRNDSPFSHSNHWEYGSNAKKLAELHALLQDNNEKIVERFGKNYRQLTQLQFQSCFDDLFNRKDAKRHLVDALWLLVAH